MQTRESVMRLLFLTFFTLSISFSQCDANDDSQLDVLDIVVQVNCILNDCWEGTSVCQDIDGNTYQTIQIGQQVWMADNLNLGTMIPSGLTMTNNLTFEKYCYEVWEQN